MYSYEGAPTVTAGYYSPVLHNRHYDEPVNAFTIEFDMPEGVSKNRVEKNLTAFAGAYINLGSKRVTSVEFYKPMIRPVYISMHGEHLGKLLEFAHKLYSWGQTIAAEKGMRWSGDLIVLMKNSTTDKKIRKGRLCSYGGWDWTIHDE